MHNHGTAVFDRPAGATSAQALSTLVVGACARDQEPARSSNTPAKELATRYDVHNLTCDSRLGRPMCGDCYDYQAAVLFNAHAGELWRRFTTYLPRYLARLGGVTGTQLRTAVRIRYVKVAEYQARGVVHFHAVVRLDAATADGTYQPPPTSYTAALLADAIDQAAAAVRISADTGTPRPITLRFGTQTDARPIHRDAVVSSGRPLDGQAVANYIAKYATKTLTAPGLPHTRIRH